MSKSQKLRSVERSENSGPVSTINHQDIAERAYALYLGRGGEDGHDVEDWLAAELELREERPYNLKLRARKASAS
jgi:hypothetical protein